MIRRRSVLVALGVLALLAAPPVPGAGPSPLGAQDPKHDCNYCHDVHGGFTSSDVALNRDQVVEQVCLTCHGDAGPGYLVGPNEATDTVKSSITFVDGTHHGNRHAVGDTTSCWDCHDHEGAAQGNLFMIPRTLTLPQGGTATVVFTDNTTQAGFTGTQGVCYVCHTQAATQANGLNGHNAGACTTCHQHEGGFGGEGGACTGCHNVARPDTLTGPHREVVSEFDRATHHVQLGGAGAAIPDEDCTTCHNQDGHPRSGTSYVVLEDPDGGSTISYDRGVDSTAVLTPFCIGCHDLGGATRLATPTTPFSDGNIRPFIDETAWLASSHEGNANAQCADCHESHGSDKVRLLTPPDSADATTKYEEEEGFCLDCHDSDGPSTLDLKSGWSTPTWWQDAATQNGALLNDRHDIAHADQLQSGAEIECVSCHDPHTASASLAVRADPDPTDGRVPGSGWFQLATGYTLDLMSEWCMDCHDNSFPTSVTAPTLPLVNITAEWQDVNSGAQHGARVNGGPVGGELYWTGSDIVVPCLNCHQEHPDDTPTQVNGRSNNLFQLRSYPLDQNGTPIPLSQAGNPFEVTTLTTGKADNLQGYFWCNTCHSGSMGSGKRTCFSCHTHGDSRF